jgi:DNA integrity scanning protein DisA with diadenylate cyclase activity
MTDIKLLSELFDEKLRGIHAKIDAEFTVVNLQLSQIKEQTTKTNNRVNHIEDEISLLQTKELSHIIDCPNVKKIDDLNVDLREYRILKKYPKIALAFIAGACLFVILTTFEFQNKIVKKQNTSAKQIEINTEKLDSITVNK